MALVGNYFFNPVINNLGYWYRCLVFQLQYYTHQYTHCETFLCSTHHPPPTISDCGTVRWSDGWMDDDNQACKEG